VVYTKWFIELIKAGGRRRIRTFEGVSQQIYSLPPLATWVFYHGSPDAAIKRKLIEPKIGVLVKRLGFP
jgi:hypothetical protein